MNRYRLRYHSLVLMKPTDLSLMFFKNRETELVAETAENIHKQHRPSEIPPEISTLIGHKFTLIVTYGYSSPTSRRNMFTSAADCAQGASQFWTEISHRVLADRSRRHKPPPDQP